MQFGTYAVIHVAEHVIQCSDLHSVLDSDDMAVGMCPTFARCCSRIVSVWLQIAGFDSFGGWEHFWDNHAYGFASLRDRRCKAKAGQFGWVLMLLACLFSCALSECWACLSAQIALIVATFAPCGGPLARRPGRSSKWILILRCSLYVFA